MRLSFPTNSNVKHYVLYHLSWILNSKANGIIARHEAIDNPMMRDTRQSLHHSLAILFNYGLTRAFESVFLLLLIQFFSLFNFSLCQ